ncbi:hypothetical protein [Cuspidothrix issatschenkoi]|uniref:Uncharacterized protein n=1 Tax=Cuspidothrix issatschenkoi CHARLIE-1 TaxID=2052836 RepID=A0A2S6CW39_9CYAN|nr:hypothetical protein [Cuspidothrix issatschenkoi]PPJ63939.1 hypothetical protein CUN59_07420 [Cuspidothrix issatschenkoi CHARLIE-1]
MATKNEVKNYLAYWFQLGKKVIAVNGKVSFLPKTIIQGDRYSQEFEKCWLKILDPATGDCYLDGTQETINELLTPAWEMLPCGRCSMPIALKNIGMPALLCPCSNLSGWPNTELPAPRSPVCSQETLSSICGRLVENF